MKNVDDLIDSASELAARGLSKGEIADELNVSRETASWLVERSDSASVPDADDGDGPDDIHVDWSALGTNSTRLGAVGVALADVLLEHHEGIDLVVGIEKAGVPLATVVARELETDLAAYTPRKHQWEEGDIEDLGGSFSRNFSTVEGRECFIVDDIITSGTTMGETIDAISEQGGTPVAGAVIADKQGVERLDGVPIDSLLQVIRVGREE